MLRKKRGKKQKKNVPNLYKLRMGQLAAAPPCRTTFLPVVAMSKLQRYPLDSTRKWHCRRLRLPLTAKAQMVNQSTYSSRISTDIPLYETPEASFDQYLENKPRVFKAIFPDKRRSQQLNELLACYTLENKGEDVIDMRLRCRTQGMGYPQGVPRDITKVLELDIVRWELQGLDDMLKPSQFSLGVKGALYPDRRGPRTRLKGQLQMSITFVLPPVLALIPEDVRRNVAESVLKRLVENMKAKKNRASWKLRAKRGRKSGRIMEPLYPIRRLTPTDIHLIEARIAANDREIQTLLRDNQRLAAAHVALKQDAAAAQDDLRRASAAAASVKADRDARVREVYDRSLKLEAEARPLDGLAADLGRVRAAIEELRAELKGRFENLRAIEGEIAAAQSELRRVPELRSEIESAQTEIHRGREAIQRESEMQTTNFQIDRAMEKHMVAMAREAEKLRSELADAEKRAMAMAAVSGLNPGPGFDLIRY
ncbi:hypothetical protein STAS_22827 [Striga asiatica]|uniref:Uncharacterized protein n=1 Tax=Striga asiatica TaxID=4170 RepID=A0A5A7QLQ4_STRAF|nr:hypothetical protein STAS_22827 [Striga asiatica]